MTEERMQLLDEMIKAGWGYFPQEKIPPDWRVRRPTVAEIEADYEAEDKADVLSAALVLRNARRRAAVAAKQAEMRRRVSEGLKLSRKWRRPRNRPPISKQGLIDSLRRSAKA